MTQIVERNWLKVVWPAGAWLRFAIGVMLLGGRQFGLELDEKVTWAVYGWLGVYAVLYLAVWMERLDGVLPAYAVPFDALLLGIFAGSAGAHYRAAALMIVLVLANAHISGGLTLTAIAAAAAAAAWIGAAAVGIGPLASAVGEVLSEFGTALEIETTYRGVAAAFVDAAPIQPALALAVLAAISIGSAAAALGALSEHRRVTRKCNRIECLENIVDLATERGITEAFWRGVVESAGILAGARVFRAYREGDVVRVQGPSRASEGSELEQTGEWIIRSLRIPLSAAENPLVRAIDKGAEVTGADITGLCEGSERAVSADVMERLHTGWTVKILVVPIAGGREGVLVAVAPEMTAGMRDDLRAVAERAAQVSVASSSERAALQPLEAGAGVGA